LGTAKNPTTPDPPSKGEKKTWDHQPGESCLPRIIGSNKYLWSQPVVSAVVVGVHWGNGKGPELRVILMYVCSV